MTDKKRVSASVSSAGAPACSWPARGTSDVVDAAVVLLATDGDEIVTADPEDLRRLAEAAGVHVELIAV